MNRTARIAWAALALAGCGAFALLGTWQLQRGLMKADRLGQQAQVMAAASPVPLPEALLARNPELPVQRVQGTGVFHEPILLLDSQQRHGQVGVRAYAVAKVHGSPTLLLVELGWIPWSMDRSLPEVALPAGERPLEGLLVPWPGAGLALAANPWPREPQSTVLLNRLERGDVQTALAIELPPVVLKLAPQLEYGYARDLEILPNTLTPERHYGYAVQWYSLAATVLVLYFILARRARRKDVV